MVTNQVAVFVIVTRLIPDSNGKSAMLVGCGYKDELSIDSTNVLAANLNPLYWALWPRW